MEISNAYSKALELEGLLLLLKSENTDNFKIDLIFTRLFEKVDEIKSDLSIIHQQYKLELYNAARQHIRDNSGIVSEADSLDSDCDVCAEVEDNDGCSVEETDNCEDAGIVVPEIKSISRDTENVDCADDAEAIAESALLEEREDADGNDCDVAPVSVNETVEPAPEVEVFHEDKVNEIGNPISDVNIVIDDAGVDVNRSAFALRARGDIRKVFTLNDNYKFRRLLFSNSQEQYANALSRVENMKSTYEAEDYFYNTLMWDKDNSEVKEFMDIISAYFMGK